ncbi:transcription factor bHLH95 [Amborella trichopoda]|uniref:transcription factor bHLH95 n=1 Tax=Amborella trichopoda TaxID=13333 RepID=UPI0005D397FD|nr:transcription factor bHLH95 [Amborella trichopoda]|eukprot:XP_011624414.1 transcription factor bHLH95 [Amborella trichopoda]
MANELEPAPNNETLFWDFPSHPPSPKPLQLYQGQPIWPLSNSDNSSSEPGFAMASAKGTMASNSNSPTSSKRAMATESDHEIHIWTERERRKKMRTMFSNLHSLLPQLPAKADKSTIVDEAVNYIKSLQKSLQALQKQKTEKGRAVGSNECELGAPRFESRESFLADQGSSRSCVGSVIQQPPVAFSPFSPSSCFQTWSSPNVVVSVCGVDAHIGVCSARKSGLLAAMFCILEKHRLEVVSAQVSADRCRAMYMIHARANGTDCFTEAVTVEDIYKLAVGEMIYWLSS